MSRCKNYYFLKNLAHVLNGYRGKLTDVGVTWWYTDAIYLSSEFTPNPVVPCSESFDDSTKFFYIRFGLKMIKDHIFFHKHLLQIFSFTIRIIEKNNQWKVSNTAENQFSQRVLQDSFTNLKLSVLTEIRGSNPTPYGTINMINLGEWQGAS